MILSPLGLLHLVYLVWGSGASDVWAAGAGGTIVHYNGTAWSLFSYTASSNLNGVWGSSAVNVWTVGDGGLLVHYAP